MRFLIWITAIMVISQDVSAAAGGGINAAAEASNAFAADLYQHVGLASEQNTFFSPSSIATALAMTSLGARGETERQMWSVLKFDNAITLENAHQAFSELLKLANGGGGDRGYQLNIANRLWGQAGYHFLPAFVDATRKYYGAPLEELNFGDAEASRAAINRWVEKQTADKIKDLLKPGVLSRDTRLVLTNAVYFKGAWAN